MKKRIKPKIFYFSVEGDTEQWYFEWLQNKINKDTNATCHVKIICNKMDPKKQPEPYL